MEWTVVDHTTTRARVPGGWLVKVTNTMPLMSYTGEVLTHYGFVTESIAFVPDTNYVWQP